MARGRWKPDIVRWDEFDTDDPGTDPIFYDNLILAEGDSWFSLSAIPTSNLLWSLRFKASTLIVNCAIPGDTIVNMSDIAKNQNYREALDKNDPYTWNAILLSGGGNDLIDKTDKILLGKRKRKNINIKKPSDYVNQVAMDKLVASVQKGYRKLAKTRDKQGEIGKKTPIIVHTYDYATPRNSPAKFAGFIGLFGPWLYTSLKKKGIPEEDWTGVADYLFDQLAKGIIALSRGRDKIKNFHVVNTREKLTRAKSGTTGNSHDWLNEIHPNQDGYTKIAKVLDAKINTLIKKKK